MVLFPPFIRKDTFSYVSNEKSKQVVYIIIGVDRDVMAFESPPFPPKKGVLLFINEFNTVFR